MIFFKFLMKPIFGGRISTIPEPDGGLHWLQDENFDEAMGS